MIHELKVSLRDWLTERFDINNMPPEHVQALTFTGRDGNSHVFLPGEIRVGRLQDDPTVLSPDVNIPSSYILVHSNDPLDQGDGWKHKIVSGGPEKQGSAGVFFESAHLVGGGRRWWRRITVEFGIYFIASDQDRDEADRLTSAFQHLLELYCDERSIVNPYGWDPSSVSFLDERAIVSYVTASHAWEGGGPPDDYIWRGAVWVEVLTEKGG